MPSRGQPKPFARRALPALAWLLAASSAAFAMAADAPAPPAGDAGKGKEMFSKKGCVACHKVDGSGGLKLTGNPTPDWRDAKRMADPAFNDAYLRDCIVNGKPKSGMVPWKKQIKPEQIEDLIAYIRTFSQKRADTSGAGGAARSKVPSAK